MAAEAHEHWLLVEQPDTPRDRMDRRPRLNRLLHGLGHGDLTFTPTFPSHIETMVASVRARAAQVPSPQPAQLGGPQAAVAEDTQEGVVALAGDGAPVGNAQEVGVVGVDERLRRPRLVTRDAHTGGCVVKAELAGQGAEHRQVDAHGRRRCGAAGASAGGAEVAAIGGDHVGVEIGD